MPEIDFATSVLENKIVVTHIGDGHVYHFPILSNGTVSLHGSRTEPNPNAKREARRYLFDAHDAARVSLGGRRRAPWRSSANGKGEKLLRLAAQQPRQIDPIILSTLASSRSTAGLVPSSGPFWTPLPVPLDESAVPAELVPGAVGLVPKAPPVVEEWCDPPPPPRADTEAMEKTRHRATQRPERLFMLKLLLSSSH
jgi:hypothetical protein